MYSFKGRLISTLVAMILILFWQFPLPSIVISVVLILGYVVFVRMQQRVTFNQGQKIRRLAALDSSAMFLAPYNDIWRNLKLSNKYCILRLGSDGASITGIEKSANPYRIFRIVSSEAHTWSDLWDLLCTNFNYNTNYDGLIQACKSYRAVIRENTLTNKSAPLSVKNPSSTEEKSSVRNDTAQTRKTVNTEKLDINNCSETELTALPGISIVISKKIIKRREELGGFRDIEEFFNYLKFKPHLEEQLRVLVYVSKMQGSLNIKRYSERSIDL